MKINNRILDKLKENNVITTSEVTELGFSKQTLTNYVKAGLLERVIHGIYMLPGSIEDDMYIMMLRSKNIIFSHETAAFLNGISSRTPFTHSVTIPNGTSLPHSIRNDCDAFYVKPPLHKVGEVMMKTTFGNLVRTYNAERTVCDILRSRSRIDEETVVSIIKNYAVLDEKDLNRLAEYASMFKVQKTLKYYMEVLL